MISCSKRLFCSLSTLLRAIRLKRDIEEQHFIFARNKVEREQNKRLEQEIIERIEGTPTSWVFA
jgi:hypothetical protein